MLDEYLIPRPVPFDLRCMDAAIQLYRQAQLWAVEVGDESAEGMLAPELIALKAPIPHQFPEKLFGRCLLLAEFAAEGAPGLTP